MIYYISIFFIFIGICLLVYNGFHQAKLKRRFQNEKLVDGPFTRFLLEHTMPKENSTKFIRYSNLLFKYDKDMELRDFYIFRIGTAICVLVLTILILGTNTIERYNKVYSVDSAQPYNISRQTYKVLSENVIFSDNEIQVKKNISVISNNIQNVIDDQVRHSFIKSDKGDLYKSLVQIHDKKSKVFSALDIIVAILSLWLGFAIPVLLLVIHTIIYTDNRFIEFCSLETVIQMSSYEKVPRLIDILISESKYFREYFRQFDITYKKINSKAYAVFLSNKNVPEEVKRLLTYLRTIELSGQDIVHMDITGPQEMNDKKLADIRVKIKRKNMKIISIMCITLLVFSIIRAGIIIYSNLPPLGL